jgi:uncharacterized protein YdaU (DUF1376 family)
MNYYSHHIGDFNSATRHLTRVEQSVYRDAIELYYDTEHELTSDIEKLARRLICISDEEKTALISILSEFFIDTPDGFYHERCDIEITKYHNNASSKARAGIASALARKVKSTDVEQVLNTCETDEQLTNNHKPITNNHIKNITPLAMLVAMDIPESLAKDWLAVRKIKKAATTQTALEAIKKQAEANGYTFLQAVQICCERGWVGFKAQWLADAQTREQSTTTAALTIFKPKYIAEQTGSYFTEVKHEQIA